MRGIDADNELFAPIAGKLHLKLASVIRLRPRAPCFPHDLVVEPLADPDGALAHGRVGLGRFNGQKIGQHLRRLPVGHHAPQPCRKFHHLWHRSIGTDFLQEREGAIHARVAIPAQHPAGIANLNGAEDGSDPARRIVLDRPERMAVRADATEKGVGIRLMADDGTLQRSHELLAIID